jgi:hypothetical protein
MKTSKTQTFAALTAMFLAALILAHVVIYGAFDLFPSGTPWLVVQGSARLVVAALLSWGLTTILFHFKR